MFSDIVGSTELATRIGDTRWRDLCEAHHATVRRELAIYRGQEVDTAGDGFYAAFDGPARAIRCACDVRDSLKSLGLSVRVAALAPPDTVLVSQTVKDLVAGSGLEFEDFGLHALKGIRDAWHLYFVKSAAAREART
jgi:class 3 adenylate cyclase